MYLQQSHRHKAQVCSTRCPSTWSPTRPAADPRDDQVFVTIEEALFRDSSWLQLQEESSTGAPGEDNAGHCEGRLLQLPSHSCCVPGCTRAWPIYSCHGENEAYRIITPPTAMRSHGNKYLFVNLKGKYNKIIMKIYVQWLLTSMHYLTKLIYHPLLSAGCSSSLTNPLNKKREEIGHSCGTIPFKTFTFKTQILFILMVL